MHQDAGPESFTSFGPLLRFLRVRARLSQRELSIAVGYSEAHLSRLEAGQRRPDPDVVRAHILPALGLEASSPWAARLLALMPQQVLAGVAVPTLVAAAHAPDQLAPPPDELLATKLYRPRPRVAQVPRPRLTAKLDEALLVPLTLIVAPAGFGKTALLSDWLANKPYAAYLALDSGDNDQVRFVRYLVACVRAVAPGVGSGTLALLDAPGVAPEVLLQPLLNELAALQAHVVLVLDDVHLLNNSTVQGLLALFSERLPPQAHLVLASREDPPFPLGRLRARGQLIELRAAQLRFTIDEATHFLRETMDVLIDDAGVTTLEARTEGWAAGLQLAALALHDQANPQAFVASFAGTNRYVVDYLAEEILDRLPPHLRTFLLYTAVLERMCGELCDAVLGLTAHGGDSYSRLVLAELDQRNLFLVPLDGERRWYRYHHLFAEVLRGRLEQGAPAEFVAQLHHRAALWYQHRGLLQEAIHHAQEANQHTLVAELLEASAQSSIARGELVTLIQRFNMLPKSVLYERPRLLIMTAWVVPNSGAVDDVSQYVRMAAELLQHDPDPIIHAELHALQLVPLVYHEQIAQALALSDTVMATLPLDHPFRSLASVIVGMAYIRAGRLAEAELMILRSREEARAKGSLLVLLACQGLLLLIAGERGEVDKAEGIADEGFALTRAADGSLSPLASQFLCYLGRLRWRQNRLAESLEILEQGLKLCEQLAAAAHFFLESYVGLAHHALVDGRYGEGLERLARGEAHLRNFGNPIFLSTLAAYRAALRQAQGHPDAAQWIEQYLAAPPAPLRFPHQDECLILARLLIAEGRCEEAEQWLARLADLAHTEERTGSAGEIRALQALVAYETGGHERALALIEDALAIAAHTGFTRVFLEAGPPMAALLREARARGSSPGLCEHLIGSF